MMNGKEMINLKTRTISSVGICLRHQLFNILNMTNTYFVSRHHRACA